MSEYPGSVRIRVRARVRARARFMVRVRARVRARVRVRVRVRVKKETLACVAKRAVGSAALEAAGSRAQWSGPSGRPTPPEWQSGRHCSRPSIRAETSRDD